MSLVLFWFFPQGRKELAFTEVGSKKWAPIPHPHLFGPGAAGPECGEPSVALFAGSRAGWDPGTTFFVAEPSLFSVTQILWGRFPSLLGQCQIAQMSVNASAVWSQALLVAVAEQFQVTFKHV